MKTKLIKIAITILLFFAGLFGCAWVFNHLNPFLGIVAFVIVVIVFLIKIIDNFKFNSKF